VSSETKRSDCHVIKGKWNGLLAYVRRPMQMTGPADYFVGCVMHGLSWLKNRIALEAAAFVAATSFALVALPAVALCDTSTAACMSLTGCSRQESSGSDFQGNPERPSTGPTEHQPLPPTWFAEYASQSGLCSDFEKPGSGSGAKAGPFAYRLAAGPHLARTPPRFYSDRSLQILLCRWVV
jgi:hypothetical protein